MEQVRVGVIGLGYMGSKYAQWIYDGLAPGLVLTAVANRGEAPRAWALERFTGIQAFDSAEALIESDACDAVLIATPHYQHPAQTILALQNGKHVLCDKPSAVRSEDVYPMNAAADAHPNLVYGAIYNQRTNPLYKEIHRIVHSGELGKLKRLNWIITDWYRPDCYYTQSGWRATWAGEGGGVMLVQSLHQLDLLQWLCGMPTKLRAFCQEGKWHNIEVEDECTTYMEFAGGATGVFVTSTGDMPGSNRLELSFEGGKLLCENDKLVLSRLEVDERTFCKTAADPYGKPAYTTQDITPAEPNPHHIGILRAFAGAILRGEPLVADGREGLLAVQLCNAIYLSSWLEKEIALPHDETLFTELLAQRCTPKK